MCLGIPMRIVEISGEVARAEVGGLQREISVALLEDVKVGQYVIVHAGFAIERLDEKDAMATLRLLDELARDMESEAHEGKERGEEGAVAGAGGGGGGAADEDAGSREGTEPGEGGGMSPRGSGKRSREGRS
jgi:hydrogenase expression/formation protein HypC